MKPKPTFKKEDFQPSVEFVLNIITSCKKAIHINIALDCINTFVLNRFKEVVSEPQLSCAKSDLLNAVVDQRAIIAGTPEKPSIDCPTISRYLMEDELSNIY